MRSATEHQYWRLSQGDRCRCQSVGSGGCDELEMTLVFMSKIIMMMSMREEGARLIVVLTIMMLG